MRHHSNERSCCSLPLPSPSQPPPLPPMQSSQWSYCGPGWNRAISERINRERHSLNRVPYIVLFMAGFFFVPLCCHTVINVFFGFVWNLKEKRGWRVGSVVRSLDWRSKGRGFESRVRSTRKTLSLSFEFFRVKKVVLTRCRCAQPLCVYARIRKTMYAR